MSSSSGTQISPGKPAIDAPCLKEKGPTHHRQSPRFIFVPGTGIEPVQPYGQRANVHNHSQLKKLSYCQEVNFFCVGAMVGMDQENTKISCILLVTRYSRQVLLCATEGHLGSLWPYQLLR
jgi:hypothetical protein